MTTRREDFEYGPLVTSLIGGLLFICLVEIVKHWLEIKLLIGGFLLFLGLKQAGF